MSVKKIASLRQSREGIRLHTVKGRRNGTSVCGEREKVTKGKGGESVIGKGLLIFELCPMNFDAKFFLGCSVLKRTVEGR